MTMAGREQPTGRIPQIVPGPERFLGRQRRGGAPRGGVPVFARNAPRLASVASRPTSATTGSAPPGAPPAPSFRGRTRCCRQGYGGLARRSVGNGSADAAETAETAEIKRDDAPTRRGNEIGCAVRPRSGLFDIVKNDGVRSCLDRRRVTMALAEGSVRPLRR